MARILIIDDDRNILYLLRQILEDAGHDVFEARDGATGLRLVRQARPELVMTDIFMPERDGLEIILALKREFPTIKTVAISGAEEIRGLSYLAMARTFGADQIIRKPFTRHEVLAAVQELNAHFEDSD